MIHNITTKKLENLQKVATFDIQKCLEILHAIDLQQAFCPQNLIIHDLIHYDVVYMSPLGLKNLGCKNIDELLTESGAYHEHYFDKKQTKLLLESFINHVQSTDKNKPFTFFQEVVTTRDSKQMTWHFCSSQVLLRDDNDLPILSLSFAFPIDKELHLTPKIERLWSEIHFSAKNEIRFNTLTEREKQMLQAIALGLKNGEIGEKYFLSEETVKTHRKNIRKKLNLTNDFELHQFASAYNLI